MRISQIKKLIGSLILGGLILGISGTSVLLAQTTPITLINANIASEYVFSSMPMTLPGCPLLGYLKFYPGGTLHGIFITDMARSKSMPFTGSYTLTGGKNITFTSDSPQVPLSNINGSIVRSIAKPETKSYTMSGKARKITTGIPVEYLILTTSTAQCPNEQYKMALTIDEL